MDTLPPRALSPDCPLEDESDTSFRIQTINYDYKTTDSGSSIEKTGKVGGRKQGGWIVRLALIVP
jgi:hypothetical protein